MYFVPDDTQFCGYYECQECGERFLDVKVETSETLKQKITIPKYSGVIKFEYAESK